MQQFKKHPMLMTKHCPALAGRQKKSPSDLMKLIFTFVSLPDDGLIFNQIHKLFHDALMFNMYYETDPYSVRVISAL